ncbi:penicillin acylase family protein [Puniceicoccaceae bacterium K14]|nr:penicillin acylase family protein [Puniceicoccaceae bacterium K14]
MKKKILLYLSLVGLLFISILSISGVGAYFLLSGSGFEMDGDVLFSDLSSDVTVTFDEYGVPSIIGKERLDVARSLGYLHASERLYSMEMQRRFAAGELSEIVGKRALRLDRKHRAYGFRERAKKDYASLPDSEKILLEAYCEGVNFGIESLKTRPWEFFVLRQNVKPWLPEDSILVGYSLYIGLQKNLIWREQCRLIMKESLPSDVFSFFVQNGSNWDSAMDGSLLPLLPIPSRESFSYVNAPFEERPPFQMNYALDPDYENFSDAVPGSNAWAISGELTESGAAMLANDMHLHLGVPNTWYRANFEYEVDERPINIFGATLPGLPLMIIGSNRSVAWGLTNSRVDTLDLVEIEFDPNDDSRYLTTEGSEAFEVKEEIIKVKGAADERLVVRNTRWGPMQAKFMNRSFALHWRAMEGVGINLKQVEFEEATSVKEFLDIAPEIRVPTLNVIVADNSGDIGWTLMGAIVERGSFSGEVPIRASRFDPSWSDVEADRYPRISNPDNGYLWNANNRAAGDAVYQKITNGDVITPARSYQIKTKLVEMEYPVSEVDMLDMQMDIEAPFYLRWRDLLVETLKESDAPENRGFSQMLAIVDNWDGEARADSAAFLLIRDFREHVADQVLGRMLKDCFSKYRGFRKAAFRFEEPLWLLVSERPEYLMSSEYEDWQSEFVACIEKQLDGYVDRHGSEFDLGSIKWGDENPLVIKHPMSSSLPFFGRFLVMEDRPASGDRTTINVVDGDYTSSERMVVTPGYETDGVFQMPGGQSAHPLSEYFRKGHEDWWEGRPSSFVGRETSHVLKMFAGDR